MKKNRRDILRAVDVALDRGVSAARIIDAIGVAGIETEVAAAHPQSVPSPERKRLARIRRAVIAMPSREIARRLGHGPWTRAWARVARYTRAGRWTDAIRLGERLTAIYHQAHARSATNKILRAAWKAAEPPSKLMPMKLVDYLLR